ncbi:MAG: MFS transporter [Actinomycetota bacterium]
MPSSLQRTKGALRSPDFRRLLVMRIVSTVGDGLFQASLITSLVFSPDEQTTTEGFALASLVIVLPFSVIGPFAGVFIDRWPRRRILIVGPLLRAAIVGLVLFNAGDAPVLFYGGALWVLSVNRFYLTTANAVVPRLVPTEDLLIANSLATIGGTTALIAGAFAGGLVADAFGTVPLIVGCAVVWLAASVLAWRIHSDLRPHMLPESPELLRHALRRVAVEFGDGVRQLVHTPRALGPITSMGIDQLCQGLILVLSLFVFRDRFQEGVGSFSYLIGAGGLGVFAGLVTVGKLEERFEKEQIIAGSFLLSGVTLLAIAPLIGPWTVLIASFFVGLSFAWKKIPADTLVQESVPDGYRGRIFAAYDVVYQGARLFAAALAIPMLPGLGEAWSVTAVAVILLLWAPVLPRWLAHVPELRLVFAAGSGPGAEPIAVVWGGVEEPVHVVRSWDEERAGTQMTCLRLDLEDGTRIDVSRRGDEEVWRLDRELDPDVPLVG